MTLNARSAVITGASRGIGRATAVALADAGVRVFLLARGASDLMSTAQSIGPRATPMRCDVSQSDEVDRVAAEIGVVLNGGTPDIIVNNAGLFPLGALDTMSVEAFAQTIDVNLVAPFRVLRAFLPAMRSRGSGHVVTIGSVADRSIFPGNGAYSASKFGQRAMQEVLRAELRGSGVRSTLISPAATDTPIWDAVDPDNTPGFPSRASMLRADDVAQAVLWALTRPAHVNVDEVRLSSQ